MSNNTCFACGLKGSGGGVGALGSASCTIFVGLNGSTTGRSMLSLIIKGLKNASRSCAAGTSISRTSWRYSLNKSVI